MSLPKQLVLLFLLLIGGWAALRYYRRQNRLYQQLEELTAILTTQNTLAAQDDSHTIRNIESFVAKNRNQPADKKLLRRAEGLQTTVEQLINTLRACGNQLRRLTGNQLAPQVLQHPRATAGVALSFTHRQALQRQLAACADTLHRLSTAEIAPHTLPPFDEATPVVEVLAGFSQLESNLLTHKRHILQRINKALVSRGLRLNLAAAAAAEANVVAPGDTYQSELLLLRYYSVAAQMTCNGRPVPVGPNGIGQVSFRAPTRPGPATWTGTIRLRQNGRDTTFKVTVPYRVARR